MTALRFARSRDDSCTRLALFSRIAQYQELHLSLKIVIYRHGAQWGDSFQHKRDRT